MVGVLLDAAGCLQNFDKRAGRAICQWCFGRIHFYDDIIQAETLNRGENMLDRLDNGGADAEGCAALRVHDTGDVGRNFGLVRQVHAAETDAGVNVGRHEAQGRDAAGVQTNPGQGLGGCYRRLAGHDQGARWSRRASR